MRRRLLTLTALVPACTALLLLPAAAAAQAVMLGNMWLAKARPSLEFKSWSPRVGVAVSLLVGRDLAPFQGGDEVGGYWSLIIGAEHRSRVFTEVQLNFSGGAPRAYFVLGYRLH